MRDQNGSSLLQVEGLNVFYGNFHAVTDVSFEVRSGEIFGYSAQMVPEKQAR